MDYLSWCNNISQDEDVQKALEAKITSLVNVHFANKGEYAIEKFVKSFSETILYLDSSLRYPRGIHKNQINGNGNNLKEYLEKEHEVKKILLSEINRLGRHYSVFLS